MTHPGVPKVLILESGISGGGSFESLVQYLNALDRAALEPVVGFLNQTSYMERVRALGIETHLLHDPLLTAARRGVASRLWGRATVWSGALAPGLGLAVLRRAHAGLVRDVTALAHRTGAGLLYCNTQISRDMYGVFAAQVTGLPCVSHLRSMDGRLFTPARAARANATVARVIANSRACRDYWVGAGLRPERVEVVYNAVPPLEAAPLDLGAHWPAARGASCVVGCVGRLVELKGQHVLLRAFARFLVARPGAVLLLVGDGPERAALERLAGELGIAGSVVFTGFETRAKEITAALDMLVLPSRYDALGRVLLEAMALGVPVIGADRGGIPEVIDHEANGLLTPWGDEQALCRAMERLAADQALRQRLVAGGREAVAGRFGIARYAGAVTAVLLGAMGPSQAPRPPL